MIVLESTSDSRFLLLVAAVAQLMAEGLSRKDAVKQTAKELDLPKNVVYDASLNLE